MRLISFFKLTPDKTLSFKHEKGSGGKMSKERITVLVCGNMAGTEKKTFNMIGKPRRPRCFKNVKILPVNYQYSRKVLMTSEFFEDELRLWDKEQK